MPQDCAPISLGCPVSCWAAERNLLHLAQVRQQLLDAMLELRKPGQRLWGLQFPSVVQPALQHCGQKRDRTWWVSNTWFARMSALYLIWPLIGGGGVAGRGDHFRQHWLITLSGKYYSSDKVKCCRAVLSNRSFCDDGNGLCLCCLIVPLPICSYWAFKTWQMQLRNWV